MKCLLITCVAMTFLLYNCNSSKLLNNKVESITIFAVTTEGQERVATIDDKNLVSDIVESINRSRREPVKFRHDYQLEINYGGDVRRVFVSGKSLNVDALTYLSEEDIGAKIKLIVKDIKR